MCIRDSVWTSMVDQIRESYKIAKENPEAYSELSRRSRERLKGWASPESVQGRLIDALDNVYAQSSDTPTTENYSDPTAPDSFSKRAA